jgi:hypothetical protein
MPVPSVVADFLKGIAPQERRVWVPDTRPVVGDNRFLKMRHELILPPGKYIWENPPSEEAFESGGAGYGFSTITEKPIMRIDTGKSLTSFDLWEWSDRWIVSQRALELFQKFDADAIAAIEIDIAHISGERYLHPVYWMDVTRGLHMFDVLHSNIIFTGFEAGQFYSVRTGAAQIRNDIDPTVHVFREGGRSGAVMISRVLRSAIEDEKLKKVGFEDYAKRGWFEK